MHSNSQNILGRRNISLMWHLYIGTNAKKKKNSISVHTNNPLVIMTLKKNKTAVHHE